MATRRTTRASRRKFVRILHYLCHSDAVYQSPYASRPSTGSANGRCHGCSVAADPLWPPLDALYLFILLRQHAPKSPALLEEWKRAIALASMSLDLSQVSDWNIFPLPIYNNNTVLSLLYGRDSVGLIGLLSGLGSLIYCDKWSGQLKLYHASFPDFTFNSAERSSEFFVEAGSLHL